MSELVTYPDRASLFAGLAREVAVELAAALKVKGQASLAVPGGTTPAPFFEGLRKIVLDWKNVTVLLTDERFVPETSVRSNARLVLQHLLQDRAAAADFIPLYQAADRPEEVLDDLTSAVEGALPLDVCVLGMGADMHIASLFPGSDLLELALADDAPPVMSMRAEGAGEPRITLTAPVLRAAAAKHILIVGSEKLMAYEIAAKAGSELQAPVRVVLAARQTTRVHYAD